MHKLEEYYLYEGIYFKVSNPDDCFIAMAEGYLPGSGFFSFDPVILRFKGRLIDKSQFQKGITRMILKSPKSYT